MDFEILPQLFLVLSVAGIVIIVGRNFSKIKELEQDEIFLEDVEEQEEKERFYYLYRRAIRRFVNRENYHQKVTNFWLWFEKFLRKTRIAFLKLDARIVSMLQNLREKNVEAVEKIKETEEEAEEENPQTFNYSDVKIEDNKNLQSSSVRQQEKKRFISDVKNIRAEKTVLTQQEEPKKEVISDSVVEDNPQEYIKEEKPQIEMKEENEKEVVIEGAYEEEISESVEPKEIKEEIIGKSQEAQTELLDYEDEESIGEDQEEESIETKRVRTKKEQEYIDALINNPRDVKSYWKLGILYSKRKNYEDSLACFRQIIKIDPTYTKAKQKAIELMEKMRGKGGDIE